MYEDLEAIANLKFGEAADKVAREERAELSAQVADLAARGLANSGPMVSARLNSALQTAERSCRALYEIWLELILKRKDGRLSREDVAFITAKVKSCADARSAQIGTTLASGGRGLAPQWAIDQGRIKMHSLVAGIGRELEIKFREQEAFPNSQPALDAGARILERGRTWKWRHYYWALCRYIGAETYKTWRWELSASVIVGFFLCLITGKWSDFRTVLSATGMTLGCFVMWHSLRAPWLLHTSIHDLNQLDDYGMVAGVFGVAMIAATVIGSWAFGRALWNARPLGTIEAKIMAPPSTMIQTQKTESVASHTPAERPQCWIRNYGVPAVSAPSPWGLATIWCNTTVIPPYSVELHYDQNVTVGPFTFPVGSEFTKSMEFNQGTKIVGMFDLHTIIPNEPFSIMAVGSSEKFPLVKSGVIRAKDVVIEFQP